MDNYIYTALFAVYGMIIGSFLNVCIYRIPKGISVAKGRSYCPSCLHSLSAADLVPLFSLLFLGRRCRYCKSKISIRYALVELLTAVCYIVAYLFSASLAQAVLYCVLASILIVISFIDIDTHEISDVSVLIILVLAIIHLFLDSKDYNMILRFTGLFAVSAPMLVIAYFTGGFGGGDIKLMAAAGLFLGVAHVILAFFIGALFGALFGIYLILRKKANRKSAFAFGPFLCIGIMTSLLFGSKLLNLYFSLF